MKRAIAMAVQRNILGIHIATLSQGLEVIRRRKRASDVLDSPVPKTRIVWPIAEYKTALVADLPPSTRPLSSRISLMLRPKP